MYEFYTVMLLWLLIAEVSHANWVFFLNSQFHYMVELTMSLTVAITDILLDWVWIILLGDSSQFMGSSGRCFHLLLLINYTTGWTVLLVLHFLMFWFLNVQFNQIGAVLQSGSPTSRNFNANVVTQCGWKYFWCAVYLLMFMTAPIMHIIMLGLSTGSSV
jgi:hypothetical protein